MSKEIEKTVSMPIIKQGFKLGNFTIERMLGVGGMGEVWLAKQGTMERKVAVKILSPTVISKQEYIDRFMSEIKLSAKLDHPNIVSAYDAGFENDLYYLAISFVEGRELDDIITEDGVLDEKRALKIVRDIASALKYAWNKYNLLHRDIKPSNIMIANDNTTKLMDMGISKIIETDTTALTMTNAIVGTPHYISPEQAKGDLDIDFRADLYSLGISLYFILTGKKPFDAQQMMGILTQHLYEPLPDIMKENSLVSKNCKTLVEKMVSKDKNDRHSSWEELIKDIDSVISGKQISKTPENNRTKADGEKIKSVAIKLKCKCGTPIIITNPEETKEVKCRKCGKIIVVENKKTKPPVKMKEEKRVEISDAERSSSAMKEEQRKEVKEENLSLLREEKRSDKVICNGVNKVSGVNEVNDVNKFNGVKKEESELEIARKKEKNSLTIKGRFLCFNCGKNLKKGTVECDDCGANQELKLTAEIIRNKKQNAKTLQLIIGIIFLILFAVGAVYAFMII